MNYKAIFTALTAMKKKQDEMEKRLDAAGVPALPKEEKPKEEDAGPKEPTPVAAPAELAEFLLGGSTEGK